MSKKRKTLDTSTSRSREQRRERKTSRPQADKTTDILLAYLYSAKDALSMAELKEHLSEKDGKEKELGTTIDSLLHEGLIIKSGKRLFALNRNAPVYEGHLAQHPQGFGFITSVHRHGKNVSFPRDPFISINSMGGAQHGDQVLIRVMRTRKDLRPEAVVLKITVPGSDTIAGIFKKSGNSAMVLPDDVRFPFTVMVDDFNGYNPSDGDAVLVQFKRELRPTRKVSGKILEVLGRGEKIDTQMRLVIEKFHLPHSFSPEVQKEAEQLSAVMLPGEDREDLRQTLHITIDGETAKDFDDAICVVKTRKGFRLFVSIADVSHFVRPGSAIDQEAYLRGTSIYFPGRVIPMLPERLSNDLCSLVPDQDRLTVSAILDFDRFGVLQSKRFCRSIICSRQRFTYTQVNQILSDKDPALRKLYKPFLTPLKWAEELALALKERRKRRGSIDFNLPEPEFTLDEAGEVALISKVERNFAHQLIEEFMLAANEAVAELASNRKVGALYRVHESPDPVKIEEFTTFAKTLGLHLPPQDDSSAWFAGVLDLCKGAKYEYIINTLLLRSMKQAQYAAENVGHFGLASTDYTHFTSPIRRYPDLIVHRTLLRLLTQPTGKKAKDTTHMSYKEAGEFLSARERTAISAERDMHERLKVAYMQKHIGDSFDAIISGVNESALFLEIPDHCLSGSLAVDRLTDDYYLLDSKNHRLFGEITAKIYRIGDPIRVVLTDVNPARRRINFALATDTPS